jgi:hypothetical protein
MKNLRSFFANRRPAEIDAPRVEPANNSSAGRPDKLEIGPDALPAAAIGVCVAKVEIALHRGNREEALAAVEAAFNVEPIGPITLDSPIADLGLEVLICNMLEGAAIFTVGDLTSVTVTELRTIANLGGTRINVIRTSMAKHGFSLSGSGVFRPLAMPSVAAFDRPEARFA